MKQRVRLLLSLGLCLALAGCGDRAADAMGEEDGEAVEEVAEIVPRAPIAFGSVLENRVRVRSGPGLDAEPVGHLYRGDLVEIFATSQTEETIDGMSARWLEVRTPLGLIGWSFGHFVESLTDAQFAAEYRRLSVATVNLPWEPGSVTEERLLSTLWEVDASGGYRLDFAPEAVVAVGGSPLSLTGNDGTAYTGVWRVRNGYLLTEIVPRVGTALVSPQDPTLPFGFVLWNLGSDALESLYRDSAFRLIDAALPGGTGEIRETPAPSESGDAG